MDKFVAILILLELTLQCEKQELLKNEFNSRNPYFIGINSAIVEVHINKNTETIVAILILLELTLQ